MSFFEVMWKFLSVIWRLISTADQPLIFTARKSRDALQLSREMKVQLELEPDYLFVERCCVKENKHTNANWDHLKHEIFCSLFENKAGCFFTTSRDFFAQNNLEFDIMFEIETRHGFPKTYIFAKECWMRDDLWQIIDSYHYEGMDIWMWPGMTPKVAGGMTTADVESFWKLTWELKNPYLDLEELSGGNGIVGIIDDGECIFWKYPSQENVSLFRKHLQEVARNHNVKIEPFSSFETELY